MGIGDPGGIGEPGIGIGDPGGIGEPGIGIGDPGGIGEPGIGEPGIGIGDPGGMPPGPGIVFGLGVSGGAAVAIFLGLPLSFFR